MITSIALRGRHQNYKNTCSAMEVRERKEKSGRTRPRREKKADEEDSGDETPDPDEIDEANVTRQRLNKDANLRGSARSFWHLFNLVHLVQFLSSSGNR